MFDRAILKKLPCAGDLVLDILRSVIVVLDPLDIILTEIASGLHLDEFEIDLAGVLQAVPIGT
jgi:hypothetical protein